MVALFSQYFCNLTKLVRAHALKGQQLHHGIERLFQANEEPSIGNFLIVHNFDKFSLYNICPKILTNNLSLCELKQKNSLQL